MKLGILGGGQLARMLTLAAYPLGIRTVCLDPNPQACAGEVTDLIVGEFTNPSALSQFLADVDCVTLETENIPLTSLEFILKTKPLYPSAKALEITQDRLYEKKFLRSLQIPTVAFQPIRTEDELTQAVADLGLPAVLKTRRFGYDGKGQYILRDLLDISDSWRLYQSYPLILEEFVSFESEFSLISVRNKHGEIRFYPLIRNKHVQGILYSSEAPFNNETLQQEAERYAREILETLQYIGVFTIEFFYDGKKLIANEMAPRVHNSGHWTIEGAYTSQFENHLRAICDLPLGSTNIIAHSFLLNCIGQMLPIQSCLAIPGVHYHQYGKASHPGRKLGHITLIDANVDDYQKSKNNLLKLC